MNIFIIGPSRSAKTPIATHVASFLGYEVISASEWVRSIFVPSGPMVTIEDKQRSLEEITRFSEKLLSENPNRCIEYIRGKFPNVLDGPSSYVLEGFRNPRDFDRFFQPHRDKVVLLSYPSSPLSPLTFETEGLSIIHQSVNWYGKCGFMPASSSINITLNRFEDVEMVASMIVKWSQTKPND
jgi:hypothetical protein